ncbi:host attachment protein [Sulfitobacter sp.]|uniref:host attachment protein n=1 Tax=Sulfitobacter sp. TaxID=1903071 RepID=UPI003561DCA1
MKATKTMIVIANSGTARFLINAGPGKGLTPTGGKTLQADPPTMYADRAGEVHSRVGPGMSAVEQTDPKMLAQADFAKEVSDFLETSFEKGNFERLIVAAGPHMLGVIRDALSEKVSKVVIAEVDKDLTHLPLEDLPEHLDHVLAV